MDTYFKNITVPEFKEKAQDYAADFADATSNLKSFGFGKANTLTFNPEGANVGMVGKLNDWAFPQICGRLNAPTTWLANEKYCPEELKIDILNQLTTKYRDDADLFIRMKGEIIRAVLSSQYSVFDNAEFIDLVSEAVDTMGIESKVMRATLDDDMRAYIVFPQITFGKDPQAGDNDPRGDGGLHPAIYISNSERGGRSVRATGAVFRGICSNGMIYGWKEQDTFEVRHRYHSHEMMAALVAEGIAVALKMSEEATKKFIAAQDVKVRKVDLSGIVNKWAESYGISVGAKENWLASITSEAVVNGRADDVRLFDVVNAATYVSQGCAGFETEQMERMAGDLLRVNRL